MSQTRVVDDDSLWTMRNRGDFTVVVAEEAGQTVAHVTGEIDIATCKRLRDAIEPHLGRGQRVVLDLSGVRFMDSSCLKVLLQAHTTLTGDGGSLILRSPSHFAQRLLSLSGLNELFDIEAAQPAQTDKVLGEEGGH